MAIMGPFKRVRDNKLIYWGPGAPDWKRDWELETNHLLLVYQHITRIYDYPTSDVLLRIMKKRKPWGMTKIAWAEKRWIIVYDVILRICWDKRIPNPLPAICYGHEHVQPLRMEWSRTGVWRPVREPIVDGLLGLPLPSQGRAIDHGHPEIVTTPYLIQQLDVWIERLNTPQEPNANTPGFMGGDTFPRVNFPGTA